MVGIVKSKMKSGTFFCPLLYIIGILIIMEIHWLPYIMNYWSLDPIFGVPAVSKTMTAKRLKILTENIGCHLSARQNRSLFQ